MSPISGNKVYAVRCSTLRTQGVAYARVFTRAGVCVRVHMCVDMVRSSTLRAWGTHMSVHAHVYTRVNDCQDMMNGRGGRLERGFKPFRLGRAF